MARAQPTDERFWAKVDRQAPNGCYQWAAYTRPDGYGNFGIGRTVYYAHRIAWELTNGPIPAGMQIDHLCRNKGCVNPAHLELVTQRENGRRGLKGVLRTRCKYGHLYTPESTSFSKQGHRGCRICRNEQQNARRSLRRSSHL